MKGPSVLKQGKLKIAVISENFAVPPKDGVSRTLSRLMEYLHQQGHQVILFGPNSGIKSHAGAEIVSTKGIPLFGVYPGLKLNFIRPLFIRRLLEFDPDVIHIADPIWLGAQAVWVLKRYLPDVPFIATYHTNLAQYATLFGFRNLTPTIWSLQGHLYNQCAITFCPSPSTATMLTERGLRNLQIAGRGADTDLFHPKRRSIEYRIRWGAEPPLNIGCASTDDLQEVDLGASQLVLLYVGRLSWEKNLRLLIESFQGIDLHTIHPAGIKLVFVGDGPARADLEKSCADYGIPAVFMGYRNGVDLATCFASADLFVFPSWTETFGQVVLEALSSGLPIIGLHADGVQDLVKHGETGLLLDLSSISKEGVTTTWSDLPSHAELFDRAVQGYRTLVVEGLRNSDQRQRMSLNARREAANRSWQTEMSKIEAGYCEVAERSRLRRTAVARRSGISTDTGTTLSVTDPAIQAMLTSINSAWSGLCSSFYVAVVQYAYSLMPTYVPYLSSMSWYSFLRLE